MVHPAVGLARIVLRIHETMEIDAQMTLLEVNAV